MGGYDVKRMAAAFNYCFDGAARFPPTDANVDAALRKNLESGKQRVAVMAVAARQRGDGNGEHAGGIGEKPERDKARSSTRLYFFESDDIGFECGDHIENALRRVATFVADAAVNVVSRFDLGAV